MFEIDSIKTTTILKSDDFDFLSNVSEELKDTLTKRQVFRTETEMIVSVLNDIQHPTNASKYWQSVREQAVMFENLVNTGFDYRRNELRIKRLLSKIKTLDDEFDIEEANIELDECIFKQTSFKLIARDRMREIKLWSKIKKELDDGSFDTTDVNTHQLVSLAQRFILQTANAPRDMPVAEANNLKGQLISTIKELERQGLLNDVLATLSESVVTAALISTDIIQLENTKK